MFFLGLCPVDRFSAEWLILCSDSDRNSPASEINPLNCPADPQGRGVHLSCSVLFSLHKVSRKWMLLKIRMCCQTCLKLANRSKWWLGGWTSGRRVVDCIRSASLCKLPKKNSRLVADLFISHVHSLSHFKEEHWKSSCQTAASSLPRESWQLAGLKGAVVFAVLICMCFSHFLF